MKIYFAGSIRGGRRNRGLYLQIINHLRKYGQVLTEHIGSQKLTNFGEKKIKDKQIYNRDLSWLKKSDVMIAEVSIPSLGIGYELAKAEEWNKKILCLYKTRKNRRLSAMISGNSGFIVKKYKTFPEALKNIDKFLVGRII